MPNGKNHKPGELLLPPGVEKPKTEEEVQAEKYIEMGTEQIILQALGAIMKRLVRIEATLVRRLPVATVIRRTTEGSSALEEVENAEENTPT